MLGGERNLKGIFGNSVSDTNSTSVCGNIWRLVISCHVPCYNLGFD